MDDIEFTFSPENFLKGIKKMTDSIGSFEKESKTKFSAADKNTAKLSASMAGMFSATQKPMVDALEKMMTALDKMNTTQKSSTEKMKQSSGDMSSFMVAKGMIIAQVLMGAFQKAFSFIKNGLPEVGKTMSIMGDIIQRNLFWPLRKEIAPILQKMLDWTRDHRAMFVKWGGVLVNVFRAVIAVVKGFLSMITAMFTPVVNMLKKLFGGVASDITDLFNIVLFKITSVVMFLQAAFMPLITQLGDALAVMVGWVADFFSGFAEGVSGISEPFADIIEMFGELAKTLSLSNDEVSVLGATFKTLGDFLGSTLYTILLGTANLIDDMTVSIKKFSLSISSMRAMASGNLGEVKRLQAEAFKNQEDFQSRQDARTEKLKNKWSGFVDRTSANFSPNSNTSSKQVNASSKVVVEQVNITVDKNTDPKKAGEGFLEGMNKKNSDSIRDLIMNQQQALGK